MTIQSDFFTLVTSITSGRVYPRRAPASPTAPYITYFRVAETEQNTLDTNGGTGNSVNTLLQVDIWATTYGEAQTKSAAVKAALKTWSVENVVISDQDFDDPDTLLHRVMLQVSTWHT